MPDFKPSKVAARQTVTDSPHLGSKMKVKEQGTRPIKLWVTMLKPMDISLNPLLLSNMLSPVRILWLMNYDSLMLLILMTHFKIGCNQMTIMQFEISLSKPKPIGGIVFQLWICIIRAGIYGHKSASPRSEPNIETYRTRRSVEPSIREIKLTVRKIPIYIILMLRQVSGRFSN